VGGRRPPLAQGRRQDVPNVERMTTEWRNPEYRTDTEQANAATVAIGAGMPEEVAWERYFNASPTTSRTGPRCAILAGRIYRDLDAFQRHPGCDCVMVPVESWQSAHDEGLVASPDQAFRDGQVRGLSEADAKAIADGADMAQVVNAAQGIQTVDTLGHRVKATTAGTTRRSAWRKANPTRLVRLRPESIYDLAEDREDVLRLLRIYGYIR
jgi:hypothetical protein